MIHAYFFANRLWVAGEKGACVVMSQNRAHGEHKATNVVDGMRNMNEK